MSSVLDATIANRLDITVKQNQTFGVIIEVLDNAGTPVSLLGAQVKMSVRQDGCNTSCECVGDSDFNQVFKQDFIPEIGGAGNNILTFSSIILLAEGYYKYDILVEYTNGKQQYILTGNFRVKRSYTNI